MPLLVCRLVIKIYNQYLDIRYFHLLEVGNFFYPGNYLRDLSLIIFVIYVTFVGLLLEEGLEYSPLR